MKSLVPLEQAIDRSCVPVPRTANHRLATGEAQSRRRPDTLGGMCKRVQCKTCNRPSWSGCGAHVELVLGDVPASLRCQCRLKPAKLSDIGDGEERKRSWILCLLNRVNPMYKHHVDVEEGP